MMQDPTYMRDLVGALGAPGAIVSLVVAFYFGARAWQMLGHKPGNPSNGGSPLTYRDSMSLAKDARDKMDAVEGRVMQNVDKTRHDVNNSVTKVGADLRSCLEDGFKELGDKLSEVVVAVREGNDRRREPG